MCKKSLPEQQPAVYSKLTTFDIPSANSSLQDGWETEKKAGWMLSVQRKKGWDSLAWEQVAVGVISQWMSFSVCQRLQLLLHHTAVLPEAGICLHTLSAALSLAQDHQPTPPSLYLLLLGIALDLLAGKTTRRKGEIMNEELVMNRQHFNSFPNLVVKRFLLLPATLSFSISIPSKTVTSTVIRVPVAIAVSQCGENQQDGFCWPLPNLLENRGKIPWYRSCLHEIISYNLWEIYA